MSEPWAVPGYDLEVMLGFGESGEVWRARECATGEVVALKRLRDATGCRQADRLALVSSPHVLRLRAVVGDVLVLDHAAGGSLAGLLARRGRLDPGEVVTVGAPVAAALARAHAAGLVHGSVSAGSVLLTSDGMPLLADLERGPGDDRSGPADDVRALAALCWQLLTGTAASEPAPGGLEPGSGARALVGGTPGPSDPSALAAPHGLPVELVEAVVAGLAADPSGRPDAAELGASLRRAQVAVPVRFAAGPGQDAAPVLRPSRRAGRARWGSGRPKRRAGPAQGAPAVPLSPARSAPAQGPGLGSSQPADDSTAAAPSAPQSWHRAGAPADPSPRGPGTVRPARGTDARGAGVHAARRGARPPAVPVVTLLVLVVLAAAAGWASGRGPVAGAASVAPPLATPSVVRVGVPRPQDAWDEEAVPVWTAVLDELDRTRARAFAATDLDLLGRVWAGGSAGLAADQDAVRALAAQGHSAHGLRHAVRDLEVVEQSATTAALRVVDVLSAHEVRDDAGAPVRRVAARPPRTWLVRLARTPPGWRLVSVAPG